MALGALLLAAGPGRAEPELVFTLNPVPGQPQAEPSSIAAAPAAGIAVTVNSGGLFGFMSIIDIADPVPQVIGHLQLPAKPGFVVHHEAPPGEHRFFVAYTDDRFIEAYIHGHAFPNRLALDGSASTGGTPYSLAVDPTAMKLYAAGIDRVEAFDIDPASPDFLTLTAEYPDFIMANKLAVHEPSGAVYALDFGAVAVIDGASGELVRSLTLPTDSIFSLAVNADNTELYAAGLDGAPVYALDMTGDILAEVMLEPGNMLTDMVYNPDLDHLYLTQYMPAQVQVMAASERELTAVIPRISAFMGLRYSAAESRLYSANKRPATVSILQVLGGGEFRELTTLPLNFTPADVFMADRDHLVALGYDSEGGVLLVYDLAGYPAAAPTFKKGIQLPAGSRAVTGDPDSGRLWITHSTTGQLAEVRLRDGEFEFETAVPGLLGIRSVLYIADAARLYAASHTASMILTYSTSGSLTDIGDPIHVCSGPADLEWEPIRELVYVPCSLDKSIDIVNPAAGLVVLSADLDCAPLRAAADPGRNALYVSCRNSSAILTLDLDTAAVLHTHPLSYAPGDLIYDPDSDTLYAADHSGDALVMFDPSDWSERARIPVGGDARSLFLDAENRIVWAAVENLGVVVGVRDPIILPPTPPDAPTGIQVFPDPANDRDLIYWDPNTEPDLAGYNIYLAEQQVGPYAKINDSGPVPDNDYAHSPAQPVGYWYRVTAVNHDELESEPSPSAITPLVQVETMQIEAGWNLIGINRTLPPGTVSQVFGAMQAFDYADGEYVEVTETGRLLPGKSYWFKSEQAMEFSPPGELLEAVEFEIEEPGWTLIGLLGVIPGRRFSEMAFIFKSDDPWNELPLEVALSLGLVDTVIVGWDAAEGQYSGRRISVHLTPWAGRAYWIRVLDPQVGGVRILAP